MPNNRGKPSDVSFTNSSGRVVMNVPNTHPSRLLFAIKSAKYQISYRFHPQIGWIGSTNEPIPLKVIAASKSDVLYFLIRKIKKEYRKQISIDKTLLKLLDMRRQKNGFHSN